MRLLKRLVSSVAPLRSNPFSASLVFFAAIAVTLCGERVKFPVEQFGVFAGRAICDWLVVESHHRDNILRRRGNYEFVSSGRLLHCQRLFDNLQPNVPARLECEFAGNRRQNIGGERRGLQRPAAGRSGSDLEIDHRGQTWK